MFFLIKKRWINNNNNDNNDSSNNSNKFWNIDDDLNSYKSLGYFDQIHFSTKLIWMHEYLINSKVISVLCGVTKKVSWRCDL